MDGLRSPDIPAHFAYALVFIVGMFVAVSSVNKLLAEQEDRWAYLPTWGLFGAYAVLPVALFWFLDYNGVISDNSLFAALVTAVAYQQIFSGGVEGIRAPGQTGAVWKAFQTWATRVGQSIDRLTQKRNIWFKDQVVSRIALHPKHLEELKEIALERSKSRADLRRQLQELEGSANDQSPTATRRAIAKALWDDLRVSERDNYGELLRKANLISRWQHWRWFRNGRAISTTLAIFVAIGLIGVPTYRISRPSHGNYWLAWQQWRFVRPSATAADEFRNRRDLLAALTTADRGPGLAKSLTEELTYRDITVESAQRILDFLLYAHSDEVTPRFVEPLIAALRAPNPDVRLRIHRTLTALQVVQFEKFPLTGEFESLGKWVPAREDSAGVIDGHMQAWRRWWKSTQETAKP